MTTLCLLRVPGMTVPVAPRQALFRDLPSNSYRRKIHAGFIENTNLIFDSSKTTIIKRWN